MSPSRLKMKSFTILSFVLLLGLASCRRQKQVEVKPEEFLEEESDFDCPEKFGYYADPRNCSRYHVCDHGKASVKACDDGLVFSTILKTCDWPYNVHCNNADGNRGDFAGRHLRLKTNTNEDNGDNRVDQADQLPTNRRQPVLPAYEDDSYWLGRPESTLLALGDEDEYVDNYEPSRVSQPDKQNNYQPEIRGSTSKGTVNNEEENNSEEVGPWFHSLNFDQVRKQENDNRQPMFQRVAANSTTTTTTTEAPSSSQVPTVSTNQRGGSGWRHRSRQQQWQPTTEAPQTPLPRKALRIGNVDDDELELEPKAPHNGRSEQEHDSNQLHRQKEQSNNYRHNVPQSGPNRIASTPSTSPDPRPQHLGSSVRRRNRPVTNTRPAPTTTTTEAPQTNPPRQWNVARAQPQNQRSPVVSNTPNRNIPEPNPFERFERRPVLRDSEDAPPREYLDDEDDDDGLDDSHYFTMPIEIRKKSSSTDQVVPKAVVSRDKLKDVSNSLDTSRRQQSTVRTKPQPQPQPQPQPVPKQVNRVNPENIYKAFQNGFNQAVKPTNARDNLRGAVDDEGNAYGPGHPSTDMEYEDVANEDEDENVEEADKEENSRPEEITHSKPNKEIVVRYDDEDDDSESSGRKPIISSARNPPTIRPTATFKPTSPPPSSTRAVTQPRLTQFVDIVVHNKPSVTYAPASSKPNTAIHVVDIVSHKQRVVTPTIPRSIVNFGIMPAIQNHSLSFYPPPPLPPVSPKQPRHTQSVQTAPKDKLTKKIKITPKKKSKAKKFLKMVPQKSYRQGFYQQAMRCDPQVCQLPNCRCGGVDIPGGFPPSKIPQIVLLTFDDSVNDLNRDIYRKLFEQDRKNPNGCPIRATFYVSHEWTDYAQVQNLYSKGHEIASHSISHSFGEKFSKERWLAEIAGQREITHLYGGVDWRDIRGMRAPFLQTGGNTMFEMLREANFSYDSSMPVYDIDPPYWPYTLDYAINHDCMIEPCPTHSIPGLWEVGMVMWEDLRGGRCSMADGCFNPSDEEGVYQMVKNNFNRHYRSNRSPFGMYFHSRWFLTDHNMKGFIRFLDDMLKMKDVYLVTNWQMLQWMQRPTPLSQIKQFAPFGCDDIRERPPQCKTPHTCKVRFRSETRTLRTCQTCPRYYPWTGNNGQEDSNNQ